MILPTRKMQMPTFEKIPGLRMGAGMLRVGQGSTLNSSIQNLVEIKNVTTQS